MPIDFNRADNLQRPPLNIPTQSTTKPLIVTGTFVSRVDNTARGERPLDSGASTSKHGHAVHFPNWRSGALAIEDNPNIAFEHWGEYWSKVHGPKFAWDEPGSSGELVLRYDQLHRIASGPSNFFPPPYPAMIDDDGKLPSEPHKRVPAYQRPRWDGLAYITYAEQEDIKTTLSQEKFAKRIILDEQVAFRMVSREVTRDFILIPSERHRDAVSLVKIHMRAAGLSREEFQQKLLHQHAQLVLNTPSTKEFVRRYGQLHNIGSTQKDPEGKKIDAVSIFAFASMNDVEDYLVSEGHAAIEASEQALTGEGSEWWTALNYSVINRLMPELATDIG